MKVEDIRIGQEVIIETGGKIKEITKDYVIVEHNNTYITTRTSADNIRELEPCWSCGKKDGGGIASWICKKCETASKEE